MFTGAGLSYFMHVLLMHFKTFGVLCLIESVAKLRSA
jgi:hypothetical protein